MSLFPEDDAVGQDGILCRETSVGEYDPRRYRGEWWEYQANQCMASLLLPRGIFREQVETAVKSEGVGSFEDAVRVGSGDRVVRSLSFCFDVSNQVVYYRLKGLGCVDNPQSTLCLNV